jgi:drug/metabolite transporter (DMT)-like permease
MVLWQTLVACVGSGVAMPWIWQTPSTAELLLVVAVGVLGAIGHYGLSAAYSRAEASLLAPLDYTSMIWAVSFGYLFWGELPDRYTVAGCAVVVTAGLYVLYRERRVWARSAEPQA